mmetsp:Transcript_12742/g.35249  ORF Transcript_12742/g.35249 Transcript_12742/m.35249 type:complete len:263 (-) Transcript_12742:46-834(-)
MLSRAVCSSPARKTSRWSLCRRRQRSSSRARRRLWTGCWNRRGRGRSSCCDSTARSTRSSAGWRGLRRCTSRRCLLPSCEGSSPPWAALRGLARPAQTRARSGGRRSCGASRRPQARRALLRLAGQLRGRPHPRACAAASCGGSPTASASATSARPSFQELPGRSWKRSSPRASVALSVTSVGGTSLLAAGCGRVRTVIPPSCMPQPTTCVTAVSWPTHASRVLAPWQRRRQPGRLLTLPRRGRTPTAEMLRAEGLTSSGSR